jgi:putative toxin-antitoxin system antitoxin component (TIGR02293 family)
MGNYKNTKPNVSLVNEVAIRYKVDETNTFTMINSAQVGIEVSAFQDLLEVTGLSRDELAGLLGVSYKTIQRYQKEEKKMNAQNSEQLLKMIVLYQKAEEVFGDIDSFDRWLRKPAAGLGNQAPLSFMQTSGGIDLIHDELQRIEHGALA